MALGNSSRLATDGADFDEGVVVGLGLNGGVPCGTRLVISSSEERSIVPFWSLPILHGLTRA